MSLSGIQVNDECLEVFGELKAKKLHRYVIFKLSDDLTKIVVDETGGRAKTFDDLKTALEADEKKSETADQKLEAAYKKTSEADKKKCRYAVYDIEEEVDGTTKNKIVFITWIPDEAPIKKKMLYASSTDGFKKKLDIEGIKKLQWSDHSDLDYPALVIDCKFK